MRRVFKPPGGVLTGNHSEPSRRLPPRHSPRWSPLDSAMAGGRGLTFNGRHGNGLWPTELLMVLFPAARTSPSGLGATNVGDGSSSALESRLRTRHDTAEYQALRLRGFLVGPVLNVRVLAALLRPSAQRRVVEVRYELRRVNKAGTGGVLLPVCWWR